VQRLFSSFADGWPGAGLLLLRLLAGSGLLYGGIVSARSPFDIAQMVPPVLAAAFGAMLVVGLFTPFAGIMAAAVEVWIAFSHPGYLWPQIGLAGLTLSLAMIGPGAWSIDARLFGRKQIDLSEL
jgi:putative oxidoreductase